MVQRSRESGAPEPSGRTPEGGRDEGEEEEEAKGVELHVQQQHLGMMSSWPGMMS